MGKTFDRHISYGATKGGFAEWVTYNEGETRNLEDLLTCSTARAGGENLDIRMDRATGGPGNADGSIESDQWKVNIRARVVDGVNVVIATDGAGKIADEAISIAVARYGGGSLPKGYVE